MFDVQFSSVPLGSTFQLQLSVMRVGIWFGLHLGMSFFFRSLYIQSAVQFSSVQFSSVLSSIIIFKVQFSSVQIFKVQFSSLMPVVFEVPLIRRVRDRDQHVIP